MEENIIFVYRTYRGDSVIEVRDTANILELTDGAQATANNTDVGGLYVLFFMVLACLWYVRKKSKRG